MANKKAVKSFMWGALTGVVTGAVTALLLAPKSGKELRKDISDTAHKVGDKTAEIGRQAGSAVQSIARKTSTFASDAKEAAGRFVTDIRTRKTVADTGSVNGEAAEQTAAASDASAQ